MRPYVHMHTCKWANAKKKHKKLDGNIGHHLKKKKTGTTKVFQRVYVFHLHAQRNHSLRVALPVPQRKFLRSTQYAVWPSLPPQT